MTRNRKEIFLLIGQKGSGKSFIGTLMDKEFGINFIRVEDWAKKIKKDRDVDNEAYLKQVFEEIEKGIRESLVDKDKIVFESTGLSGYFDAMLEHLTQDFKVITIGVKEKRKTCLGRVKTRDQAIHINVSDDQVKTINEKVREKNFKTDFFIHNEDKTKDELTDELKVIVAQIQNQ